MSLASTTSPTGLGTERHSVAVPAHLLPQRTPRQLLFIARQGLAESREITVPGLRYAGAHLSALRAAAAVLAAWARPAGQTRGQRHRVTSVWQMLTEVAPTLTEWSTHFATGATKRAAAEAGIPRVVSAREADDLVVSAGQFLDVVAELLNEPGTLPFPVSN